MPYKKNYSKGGYKKSYRKRSYRKKFHRRSYKKYSSKWNTEVTYHKCTVDVPTNLGSGSVFGFMITGYMHHVDTIPISSNYITPNSSVEFRSTALQYS